MFFLIPAFGIPSPRHGGSLKKCTDKFGEGKAGRRPLIVGAHGMRPKRFL
jgi:hypothetical protein